MPLAPPITDIEQLKGHPALARLLEWNSSSVPEVKFDRDEMTIYVDRSHIREACALTGEDFFVAGEDSGLVAFCFAQRFRWAAAILSRAAVLIVRWE